jgi:hypothetical protein
MIDARHVENPPEMSCLMAIRPVGEWLRDVLWQREPKLDSTCIPGVQGSETRHKAEKLLCGA